MSKLEKVRQLIAMATNAGTAPEEARSFALTAVRLIASEGIELRERSRLDAKIDMLDDMLSGQASAPRRRWPDAGPSPRARPMRRADGTDAPAAGDRMITTKAAGFCAVCRDTFPKGERVVWRTATQDLAHAGCHASNRTPEPSPG